MRKPLIDSSLNTDEKVKKISKIIDRLGRRSPGNISAIITPVPISNCIEAEGNVDGVIMKYMFCCPGVINKGGIFLNSKPNEGAGLIFTVDNELGGNSITYKVSRKNLLFEPKLKVDTWDRLTVSFYTANPEKDKISELWIALLWTPTVKDATVKRYLVSDLDSKDVSEE